jgi:signal transduction histidine kinase
MVFRQACELRNPTGADGGLRTLLGDQLLWLVSLRWLAVLVVLTGTLLGTRVFPVLTDPRPLYVVAAVLLACNVGYAILIRRDCARRQRGCIAMAMLQIEVDLLALTAVLHFAGGVTNPFLLFYVFHVIIATIILPRSLSFSVGLTAIALFGLLTVNELHMGAILGHYPLQLSSVGGIWRNPVYGLAAFVAFACTVMLAQYLTRMIIGRMAAKEREAARNSDLLRAIINAMAEGLIFMTTDGAIALCNPAAQRWRRRAGDGHSGQSNGFPGPLSEHIRNLRESRGSPERAGEPVGFDTDGPGQRFVEIRSYPVASLDGAQLGHVIVGQDLTERRKLEADLLDRSEQLTAINEMLKESRVRMAQREKMVALGQMAAGIAHEIGNPLTSLSSVVQYLNRKCTDPQTRELCSTLDHHVARISTILKRMLSLARPATAEYTWVDINEVIRNVLSLIRFDKRAQPVTIADVHNGELPTVWLNPQNLEQCMINVVLNALDAMDAKGPDPDHRLDITKSVKDEMVEIRIADTGVGMSPDVCRRAFESFFTTKEISKGTGLGLFISYNLISEVDGTIELQSEPGRGTTVVIRVPVRPQKDLIAGGPMEKDRGDDTRRAERSCL